jgi:hypothetical protein
MGFAALPDTTGYNVERDRLVVSVNQTTTLYLPNFGSEKITVRIDKENIASIESQAVLTDAQKKTVLKQDTSGADAAGGAVLAWFPMTKIVVKGKAVGDAQLIAELPNGSPSQEPTKIVVVQNASSREVDGTTTTGALRQELQTMRLRDAAVRVAEDQVFSGMKKQGTGDGRYNLPDWTPEPKDWCGAFVFWCYKRAAEITGRTNPLGNDNDVALSPQKAIGWALANPASATLLRYKGAALFQWKQWPKPGTQDTYIDAIPGSNLLPGDVCLLRNKAGDNWQHVCMVYDPGSGGSFMTLDGNQGATSLKRVLRDFGEKTTNGLDRYVFVHLEGA